MLIAGALQRLSRLRAVGDFDRRSGSPIMHRIIDRDASNSKLAPSGALWEARVAAVQDGSEDSWQFAHVLKVHMNISMYSNMSYVSYFKGT
jgi:hypothetical protein